MARIRHRVGIRAARRDVYEAVHLPDKLAAWWATSASGKPEVGGQLRLEFPGYDDHVWEVVELAEDAVVHLRCRQGPGPWIDSELRFDLAAGESQVYVTLTHSNLDEQSEAYLYFNTKWVTFLLSLKDFLETGTGQPFPRDVQIDHD